ncbi:MAG: substrate-binding domain-containing protein [Candidatus Poribacteria bacterium]
MGNERLTSVLQLIFFLMIIGSTNTFVSPSYGQGVKNKWASAIRIRFFTGGAEGDAFGSIVYAGALQAAKDTGANVECLFSDWSMEKMTQQLRESIATKPDGIAMMGHPADDAIMPLAAHAKKLGVLMIYLNVDVPAVRSSYGGGYIGADLSPQGYALGVEAIKQFKLKSGDKAIIFGPWNEMNRALRELGTVKAFEDIGMKVIKIFAGPDVAKDPNLLIPVHTSALLNNPDTKLIAYPGGQALGNAPTYLKAARKKPGDIFIIGFDTSPQIMDAFDEGWIHLTSDQQPFLQGYLPVLSLCLQKVYGFEPLNVDTGAGFVTPQNYTLVAKLARDGYR